MYASLGLLIGWATCSLPSLLRPRVQRETAAIVVLPGFCGNLLDGTPGAIIALRSDETALFVGRDGRAMKWVCVSEFVMDPGIIATPDESRRRAGLDP